MTVLGAGFLLLISLLLNAWTTAMSVSVSPTTVFVASGALVALLFATLYKVVPDVSVKWSDVTLGASITGVLFMLGRQLMAWYFAHTNLGSTYSAAGSPIVVLLWVYYSAQLFFWGAEFSKAYAKTVGSQRERRGEGGTITPWNRPRPDRARSGHGPAPAKVQPGAERQ